MRTARTLVTVGMLVVASLLGGAPQPAGAVQFSISGLVTNAGAVGIPNVLVYLYEGGSAATCCTAVTGGTTDSAGAYSFMVDAGTYRARFYPPAGYVEEWHSDAPDFDSAADLDLTSSNATNINAVLAPGVGVSGTVTAAGGGALSGIGVHAFDATQPCCTWITGTQTDASGAYTLTLANGSYRLLFYVESGSHLSGWFDSALDFDTATDLIVAGTALTGKDAQLVTGQTISGTVTAAGGALLADVFVGAFKDTTCCEWVAGTQTDAAGNYTLAVADGTYRLMFYPWSGNALMEWWNDAADFDAATPIPINGQSEAGKNAELATGLTINGTVTSGGVGVENVFVGAFNASGLCCEWVNGTGTDSLGKYSMTVPPGTYRVMFYPYDGTHLEQWWNAAANFETAVDVVVVADVNGINAALVAGTKITGRVTSDGTTPIANVFVGAFDGDPNAECCTWIAGTGTDSLGKYELVVPPNGSYKLMFYPYEGTFLMEWWNDAADFGDATAIPVGGSDVPDKNAVLATGLQISGMVSANGGGTLEGVGVIAFVASSGDWVGGAMTDAAGAYSITVPNGDYKLMFQGPPGYLTEWHSDKADITAADPIALGGASKVVNASLAAGRLLSGTVTSSGGGALSNAFVSLWTDTTDCATPPTFVNGTVTDGLGNYVLTVAAGTYKVSFFHETHASEWYNDKAGCDAANEVPVGTVDVPEIDAALAPTFLLSGMVTSSAGGALAGIDINVTVATADAVADCTTPVFTGFAETTVDGTYSVRVPNGSYRVAFFDMTADPNYDPGHQGEYWQNVIGCSASTSVPVASAPVVGIDAVLAVSYNVTGTVTDDAVTPNAIAGANVIAWLNDAFFNQAFTAANGTYRLDLPPGDYKISFHQGNNDAGDDLGCTDEWWNDKSSNLTANTVPVTTANVANISAALAGCP